jgi:hypothetical protein
VQAADLRRLAARVNDQVFRHRAGGSGGARRSWLGPCWWGGLAATPPAPFLKPPRQLWRRRAVPVLACDLPLQVLQDVEGPRGPQMLSEPAMQATNHGREAAVSDQVVGHGRKSSRMIRGGGNCGLIGGGGGHRSSPTIRPPWGWGLRATSRHRAPQSQSRGSCASQHGPPHSAIWVGSQRYSRPIPGAGGGGGS